MEELGDVDEREEQGVSHLFVLGRPTLSFFLPPLSCLLIIHWDFGTLHISLISKNAMGS